MADSNGVYFGEDLDYQRVTSVAISDFTRPFELDFEDLDATRDGKPVSVEGFAVMLPKSAWSQLADSVADGDTLAQLLSEVTIEYAANSGPHKALGHRQLVSKLDGHRLLNVLTLLSGRAPFPALGSHLGVIGTVTTAVLGPTLQGHVISPRTGQRIGGEWLHGLGPFASAVGAPVAVSERIMVCFWIGSRSGHEDALMPAEWFKGSKGCKGAEAGRIRISLGSSVDGQAVTWGPAASGADATAELYAIVRKCGTKQPAGNPLEIKVNSFAKESASLPSGLLAFVGFAKPLSSGDMVAHSYSDVDLTNDGAPMIDSRMSEHMRMMNVLQASEHFGFGYAAADGAIASKAKKIRRINWCTPLIQSRPGASLVRMRGTDREGCIKVRVNTSGESSHELLIARYLMWTDAARSATVQAAQSGCANEATPVTVVPNLRNGNAATTNALASLVPQVISRTAVLTQPIEPK